MNVSPERKNWTFEDWRRKDHQGLETLRQTNKAAFDALFFNAGLSIEQQPITYLAAQKQGSDSGTAWTFIDWANKDPHGLLLMYSRDNGKFEKLCQDSMGLPEMREHWNFIEWRKNDPAGLEEMRTKDPEKFNKLLNDLIE